MKVKYIGMMFLASFIGIMVNPEFLAASDSVAILDLEQSNVVETVIEKPVEVEPVKAQTAPVQAVVVAKTATPAAPKAGAAKTAAPAAAANQVKFAWGAQNLVLTDSTGVDAGANVMKSGRLMWAHNNTAFNNIKNLKIGDTFSVTVNGATKNYKVAANSLNGAAGIELKVTGGQVMSYGETEITTGALKYYGFGGHDLVLMTCAGAGNTHRYVVVADEI